MLRLALRVEPFFPCFLVTKLSGWMNASTHMAVSLRFIFAVGANHRLQHSLYLMLHLLDIICAECSKAHASSNHHAQPATNTAPILSEHDRVVANHVFPLTYTQDTQKPPVSSLHHTAPSPGATPLRTILQTDQPPVDSNSYR